MDGIKEAGLLMNVAHATCKYVVKEREMVKRQITRRGFLLKFKFQKKM